MPASLCMQTCSCTSQILRTLSFEKLKSCPRPLLNWTWTTLAMWPRKTCTKERILVSTNHNTVENCHSKTQFISGFCHKVCFFWPKQLEHAVTFPRSGRFVETRAQQEGRNLACPLSLDAELLWIHFHLSRAFLFLFATKQSSCFSQLDNKRPFHIVCLCVKVDIKAVLSKQLLLETWRSGHAE